MPVSVASKLGIQFARFVAASSNAANTAHHGFRGAFNNAGSVFGSSAGSNAGTSGSWTSGLSSGGASAASNGGGSGYTGVGGAKFHAGRGAHSSFQQSGRVLANVNGSSAHDGTNTLGDDDDDASLQAAHIHRVHHLHRSTILSASHRSRLASIAGQQRIIDSRTLPSLQLILPNTLSRSTSHTAALHTSPASAQDVQIGKESDEKGVPLHEIDDASQRDATATAPQAPIPSPLSGDKLEASAVLPRRNVARRQSQRRARSLSEPFDRPASGEDDTRLDFATAVEQTGAKVTVRATKNSQEQSVFPKFANDLFRARKNGDAQLAKSAVAQMLQARKEKIITPYYNLALEALLETRKPNEDITPITDLYVHMINSSCFPNIRTLSTIVRALCDRDVEQFKKGKASENKEPRTDDYFSQALSIMNVAHTSCYGFQSIEPYNAIMRSCMVRGDAERACEILNILSGRAKVKTNSDTFMSLLQCLRNDYWTKISARQVSSSSKADIARMLGACKSIFDEFEAMRNSEGWEASTRDINVWNVMIRLHIEMDDAVGALDLVGSMTDQKPLRTDLACPPVPNADTSAAIMLSFCKIKDFESAAQWFEKIANTSAKHSEETIANLPMPRLSQLGNMRKSFLFTLRPVRLRDAEWAQVESLLPNLRMIHKILPVEYDIILQGLEEHIPLEMLSEILSITSAAAHRLHKQGQTGEASELLDSALKLVDLHFQACVKAVLDTTPSPEISILASQVAQSRQAAIGFATVIVELIAAGRVEDAASLLTYAPPIFMGVDLGGLAHQYHEPKTFMYAKQDMIRLGLALLSENSRKPAELLVNFVEMAAAPLEAIGCIDARIAQAFAGLYGKVRTEHDLASLPLSTAGWETIHRLVTHRNARGQEDLPYLEFLDDLAKASVEVKAALQPQVLTSTRNDEYGATAIEKLQAIWPDASVNTASATNSQADESLFSPTELSSSVSETSFQTLPAIQLVDQDLGRSLVHQIRFARKQPADLSSALQRMREAMSQTGTYPDPKTIAALVAACGRAGDVETIKELSVIGSHIISALGGDPEWQQSATHELSDGLMRGLAHGGDAKGASEQRHKMISTGGVPSADSYAALIAVVRDTTDDALVAEELFEESQRLNVTPTVYLFNTVISKLCRARKIDKAMSLFNQMQLIGLSPSSVTFGALINGATRTDDEARAEMLFEIMERDLRPAYAKAPPFNNMIQYYTSTRPNRAKAQAYHGRMRALKVASTEFTYKLLLEMHCVGEPIDIAGLEGTFGELIADASATVQPYHWATLITAHGKHARNLDKAVAIFRSIPTHPATRKATSTKPDAVIYEAMFEVLLAHDQFSTMLEYLEEMRNARVTPTAYVANVLLNGLAKHDIQQARALFAEMDDPPAGVAAAGNHPHNHRHHADTDHVTISAPQPPPLPASPSNYGFAGVLREPSTFQTMIALEMQYGEPSAASWLLERMEQRGYPPAVVSHARKVIVESMAPSASTNVVGDAANAEAPVQTETSTNSATIENNPRAPASEANTGHSSTT